jgi:Ca2+-binding RTX toxin-like protein
MKRVRPVGDDDKSSHCKEKKRMRRISILTAMLIAAMALPATAGAAVFTNPTTITLPNAGIGSPYPSPITVSGLNATVADVRVTANDVNYDIPGELRIALVGPTGAALMLQDCSGGDGDLVNVDTTFDDAAAAFLPQTVAWTSGNYKPSKNCPGVPDFPAPGPGTSYGVPGPIAGSATLKSTFEGIDPNGVWNLFTWDTTTARGGGTIGGWSLDIVERGRCFGQQATITGTSAGERIVGTPGRDVIQARRGKDRISGLAGNDLICGARGKDKIFGGKGSDVLIGGDQADLLDGGSGKNRIFGGTPKAPDKNSKNICTVDGDDKSSHCKEK